MNKKGQLGDQLIMFAFILLLLMIGGGVVIGTYMFVGGEFDFRGVEAKLLSYKIASCVSPGSQGAEGFWLDGLTGDDKADLSILANKCGLNSRVMTKNNLVKICVDESSSWACVSEGGKEKIAFSTGGDFEPCGFKEGEKFLGCSVYQTGRYTIVTTSRQAIRRIQS